MELPTLYEYYTGGGIQSGLSTAQTYFTLNNKNLTIYGGSLHYFRVPQAYWRDRLRKMRAAGLNTVDTYVPWNLHEPEMNYYDFGYNGSEMEEFLDLVTFLKTAQEEDLLAIVRPGPYICAEWEYGGLPSWLLREPNINVRSSDPNYMKHVTRYFNVLLPILAMLQFTRGGPIIAFQVENEYGATSPVPLVPTDRDYLQQLRYLFINNGIIEQLLTSDNPILSGNKGTLPEYFFQTANFKDNPYSYLSALKSLQPNKPLMVMEYWTGWFDHWGQPHSTTDSEVFADNLKKILNYPASVNMYMFHGGTNFKFLNGANVLIGDSNALYSPQTTSYDYDAPLTEAGDYTAKYNRTIEIIRLHNQNLLKIPDVPNLIPKVAYPPLTIQDKITFEDMLQQVSEKFSYQTTIPMEFLPINGQSGQSYGYVVYRKVGLNIAENSYLKIEGYPYDRVMVLINGILVSKNLDGVMDLSTFGYWNTKDGILFLGSQPRLNATLELITENWGRNNLGIFANFRQFKGLWEGNVVLGRFFLGLVFVNSNTLTNWEIVPLEFKRKWTNSLSGWTGVGTALTGPALFRAIFEVINPQDTFIDMRKWNNGIVIINGFVLGRYASPLGPQQTLYLPAPFLKVGTNTIIVLEYFTANPEIRFVDKPIYYVP